MATAQDLVIKIRTDDGQLNSGLDKAERKLNDFGNAGKKIVGLIGGAFAVERIASFTMEITKLGGELEGVRAAFERIATAQDLKAMQEATKGTVSELNLMKRAVMAENLGLPIENLANLFEFATKRAQDTGESVDYLVESIVTGIGRKSPLILDNLGISAVELREKLKGVGTETASVADIAAAVGEIAADSMEKSGAIIENSTIKAAQAKAAWDDLRTSWGETISTSEALISTLDGLNRQMELLPEDTQRFERVWRLLFGNKASKEYKEGIDLINKGMEDFLNTQNEAAESTKTNADANKESSEAEEKREKTIGDLRKEVVKLKADLEGYTESQFNERQATLLQIEATENLIKSLTRLNVARIETPDKMQTRGETPQIGAASPGGQEILMPEFEKLDAYGAAYLEKYGEMMAEVKDEVELLNAAVNMAIVDGMVGGLEALMKGTNFGGVMTALLSPLAAILEQEGKILIAAGIGLEVFKQSLSSLNGPAAIAQGAILIGLAQGMKALGNIGSTGGAGGGGYGSAMGGGSGTGPGNFIDRSGRGNGVNINITGELTAQGSSLKYVLEQVNYEDKITRIGY
jgi:hypothetical protein